MKATMESVTAAMRALGSEKDFLSHLLDEAQDMRKKTTEVCCEIVCFAPENAAILGEFAGIIAAWNSAIGNIRREIDSMDEQDAFDLEFREAEKK